ncbi:MAG: Rsd/AlgQ family anti-sigma factor [Pseudomonadales bacterium]|nr:Rsd/AlgQ family anti-sigma factor [Pseudomonadales bacterium]
MWQIVAVFAMIFLVDGFAKCVVIGSKLKLEYKGMSTGNGSTQNDLSGLIERWLNERQELILLYVAIDGLRQFAPKGTPVSVKVQAFCQVLMDYVSAGHFEVYDRLITESKGTENQPKQMLLRLLSGIQKSTDLAVTFNEIYDTDQHCDEELISLPEDLSKLGELLAERFDLEDLLVDACITAGTVGEPA